MKIVFISHCGLQDNSGIHISNIASELLGRGHECAILIPGAPEMDAAALPFPVISFGNPPEGKPSWWQGLQPDIIHAWTPREHVRKAASLLHAKSGAAIIVHMEDNEEQIIADLAPPLPYAIVKLLPDFILKDYLPGNVSHPRYYRRFVKAASGYTCLIDRLLEFKPAGIPGMVFWPGYSPEFALDHDEHSLRSRYGLRSDEIVLVYTGNIHRSIVNDMHQLYAAIASLRQRGYAVKLIKTGRDSEPIDLVAAGVSEFVVDLGFIERSELPRLLSVASILIQPGAPSRFNDYRFPAKLAEYLVSGRPVILPNTNIGRSLRDGYEVLKLETGTSAEIAERIERLVNDPVLAQSLATNSRKFAMEHLTWRGAAQLVEQFYQTVMSASGRAPTA